MSTEQSCGNCFGLSDIDSYVLCSSENQQGLSPIDYDLLLEKEKQRNQDQRVIMDIYRNRSLFDLQMMKVYDNLAASMHYNLSPIMETPEIPSKKTCAKVERFDDVMVLHTVELSNLGNNGPRLTNVQCAGTTIPISDVAENLYSHVALQTTNTPNFFGMKSLAIGTNRESTGWRQNAIATFQNIERFLSAEQLERSYEAFVNKYTNTTDWLFKGASFTEVSAPPKPLDNVDYKYSDYYPRCSQYNSETGTVNPFGYSIVGFNPRNSLHTNTCFVNKETVQTNIFKEQPMIITSIDFTHSPNKNYNYQEFVRVTGVLLTDMQIKAATWTDFVQRGNVNSILSCKDDDEFIGAVAFSHKRYDNKCGQEYYSILKITIEPKCTDL